jgi:hypothetical protein
VEHTKRDNGGNAERALRRGKEASDFFSQTFSRRLFLPDLFSQTFYVFPFLLLFLCLAGCPLHFLLPSLPTLRLIGGMAKVYELLFGRPSDVETGEGISAAMAKNTFSLWSGRACMALRSI